MPNQDEDQFIKAHNEQGVNFKSFNSSKNKADECANSSFSLLRQMAYSQEKVEQDTIVNLLKQTKEQASFESPIDNPKIKIADVARPLKNRSSIHSFLQQNVQADEAVTVNSYTPDFTVQKTATAFIAPTQDKPSYKNLFKSKWLSDRQQSNSDNLQDIYKRLLQCQ